VSIAEQVRAHQLKCMSVTWASIGQRQNAEQPHCSQPAKMFVASLIVAMFRSNIFVATFLLQHSQTLHLLHTALKRSHIVLATSLRTTPISCTIDSALVCTMTGELQLQKQGQQHDALPKKANSGMLHQDMIARKEI